jgi:hypothetical protein
MNTKKIEDWTISEDEWDERREKTQDIGIAMLNREPCRSDWGLFAYGDAPPAIGGGFGLFQWFSTQVEMLDYVKRHLTFMNPGLSSIDPGRVAHEVQELVKSLGQNPSAEVLETARLPLNHILQTFSQVEWWGAFEDLLQGDHSYATKVRAWFRDGDEESTGRPIQEDELAAFIDAIGQYGF